MRKSIILSLIIFLSAIADAQSYKPVAEKSKVHFVIKNFGIKTGGDFTGLKGSVVFDPASLNTSRFDVSVDATTVDTDNNARDKHLRKEEFFDVEKYPLITFESTKITQSEIANRYFVIGKLTIKGVTKQLQFGFTANRSGDVYEFKGGFKINRRDFGVGGSSISMADELDVSLDVNAEK